MPAADHSHRSMFQNINVLLRTVVLGGLVAIGGWWTLFLKDKLNASDEQLNRARQEVNALEMRVEDKDREIRGLNDTLVQRDEEIVTLEADIEKAEAEIEALDIALQLLKVDTRIARIEVLSQGAPAEDPEAIRTVLRFTELDADGNPIVPGHEVTVDGKTVYVDTLVVKFQDSYVEQGDVLRGTSICLFRRLFGEDQKPADGEPVDSVGQQPAVYAGDNTPSPLHRDIWKRFWDYANDPELAAELGVRAIHGEAPFIETRPGKTYRVELRSSGGITIRPEE